MSRRLASGGRIDRGRPLAFTFDGRRLTGLSGDTLASALLANDVSLVGRRYGSAFFRVTAMALSAIFCASCNLPWLP